jgi:outer membrane receptor protein involved in Fe transport
VDGAGRGLQSPAIRHDVENETKEIKMMMKHCSRILLMGLLMLLAAIPALAQGTTGSLVGTVVHERAPLPGVTVTITSPALQGSRVTVTNETGSYQYPALPPGEYMVLFEMSGMQPVQRTTRVGLAQTARVDADLRLAAVAEAITVTAAAPAVAETTEVQTNIQADLVDNLPMGRTLAATTLLAPGTTSTGPNNGITISGAYSYDNLFLVNGAVVNENLRGQAHNLFIEDAIQETTVITGGISAEFGRFTGGVVTAVTKSGGNEFSGSLRNSLTNPAWTATTPQNEPAATSVLNEVYEATLGGRIIRDRLWFFTAGRYFETSNPQFLTRSTIPFTFESEERRLEGKLTGALSPRHNLVASYLDVQTDQRNVCFISCWELDTLVPERSLPNDFFVGSYSGVVTNSLLVEATYSQKNFSFVGAGGSDRTFTGGTHIIDWAGGSGGRLGAPAFCGVCDDEERNNTNLILKGNYYLSTGGLGTHNLVFGAEDWTSTMLSNNHQSASDFVLYVMNSPVRAANGAVHPVITEGDWLVWWPILERTTGSDWTTRSLFLNDRWDVTNRLSLNLGARYDVNDGRDMAGNRIADDSKISPRLGVNYDLFGNGRLRLNASYSTYVSKIAEANVGDASSAAGNPALLGFWYGGPTITGLPAREALAIVEQWFTSVGGVNANDWVIFGGTPGIEEQIPFGLKSPAVNEISLGMATQIGSRGWVRGDYITREWNDFYTQTLTTDHPQAIDPLAGPVDVTFLVNSNDFTREYEAIQLQAGYRMFDRLNLGGSYTWSETVGNIIGETAGSGPVAAAGPTFMPEYYNFAQNNPVGYLPQDQTHKLRGWVSYDQPTPVGNFNFSVLQRFDSGTPYSAIGAIDVRYRDAFNPGQPGGVENPGYNFPPTSVNYFFSDRGAFRWDDVTATDVALNYYLPIRNVNLFLQGELINAFNQAAQISGNTAVITRQQDASLLRFNPLAGEVPVEGVHYRLGGQFGQPTSPNHYQLPRTYRFSAGLRF